MRCGGTGLRGFAPERPAAPFKSFMHTSITAVCEHEVALRDGEKSVRDAPSWMTMHYDWGEDRLTIMPSTASLRFLTRPSRWNTHRIA